MTLRFIPFLLVVPFVACSTKKPIHRGPDPLETVSGFCQSWAENACSADVIDYCQTNVGDCQDTQADYCESLFAHGDYDRTNAEECLQAVKDAYEDGDLSAFELKTVRNLENRCAGIINGSGEEGDDCDQDTDCNIVDGFACVKRVGEGGTCQKPEEVEAGRSCSKAAAVCEAGFYCNGSNCVEQKNNSAPCQLSVECGEGMYCLLDGSSSGEGGGGGSGGNAREGLCVNKRDIGDVCDANEQCVEDATCVIVGNDDGECLARGCLGRSEPICVQELS